MIEFSVNVIGFNAENFACNYSTFVKSRREDYFGNVAFDMQAPRYIYDEIAGLSEEFIDIVNNQLTKK